MESMNPSVFIQDGPTFAHPYESDRELKELIETHFTNKSVKGEIEKDLIKFGSRLMSDIYQMSLNAEENPPKLKPYGPWGKRIDEIVMDKGWSDLDKVSAEEGIIAIGYERKYAELSRFYQFTKLYLYHPSSAFYTCPLAMTDGAAKLIEVMQDDYLLKEAYPHIISRDPNFFWTSGQWMTERPGGSDVSNTETIAKWNGKEWEISGVKWFTSATTSQMAMTLARIVDDKGNTIAGSKGLSLFYIKLRNDDGSFNGIEVLRLKDKLGTKALPTAELQLTKTKARLVGEIGFGVKNISHLFNVTRLYNACTCIGAWRRILNLSIDYAQKRSAFRKEVSKQPLHQKVINECKADFSAAFQLTFFTTLLLGKEECLPKDSPERNEASTLLRLLTPITKLLTAKRNVIWTSELVESFGGAGYIEDTGIPKFLRDGQVFSIWEGTTNILSLDMLRALKEENTLQTFIKFVTTEISSSKNDIKATLLDEFKRFQSLAAPLFKSEDVELHARSMAFLMGDFISLSLMVKNTDKHTNAENINNLKLFHKGFSLRLKAFEQEIESSSLYTQAL